MKQINEVIKLSQIQSADRPTEQGINSSLPDVEYVEIILDLFEALADLFQNQCKAQGLMIFDDDDNYTRTFEKWCRKLFEAGITRKDMRRGMSHLEAAVRDSVRTGNEVWPPNFSAFIGHCRPKVGKMWKGLPAPTMSNEDRKEKMKAVLDNLKK